MKNFRTSGEQDTYIKEKKLPEDFFKKGQEDGLLKITTQLFT